MISFANLWSHACAQSISFMSVIKNNAICAENNLCFLDSYSVQEYFLRFSLLFDTLSLPTCHFVRLRQWWLVKISEEVIGGVPASRAIPERQAGWKWSYACRLYGKVLCLLQRGLFISIRLFVSFPVIDRKGFHVWLVTRPRSLAAILFRKNVLSQRMCPWCIITALGYVLATVLKWSSPCLLVGRTLGSF